jgi:uncharacterized protein YycO
VILTLAFFHGTRIFSRVIEYVSFGPYSHVAAVWSPTEYLDSYESKVGDIPPGVHIRPMKLEPDPHTLMTLEVTTAQYAVWQRFLAAQVGLPYDWPGIFGMATDRDWRQPGSWFCSELQAAALEEAGICPKLVTPLNKVTPAALAMTFSALKATVVQT